jgi:nitroreductase
MAIAALESRHTYRAYDKTYTIPREQIDEINRLTLLSPTARDAQEIDVITVVSREELAKLSELIISTWPDSIQAGRTARMTALGCTNPLTCDASALVFLVRNARASQSHFTDFDAGIAAMAVMIAARAFDLHTMCLGLVLCGDTPKVEAALGIPTGSLIIGIALGKALSDPEVKTEKAIIAKATVIG